MTRALIAALFYACLVIVQVEAQSIPVSLISTNGAHSWQDGSIWSTGVVPDLNNTVTINEFVSLSSSANVDIMNLTFAEASLR